MIALWMGCAALAAAPEAEAPAGVEESPVGPTSPREVADMLDMDPELLKRIQTGLDQIYERRYDESVAYFKTVEAEFPNTGLAAIAETVIWQARMLENFDYRHEKEYWQSSKRAKKQLTTALSDDGSEAWEHLAMAAIVGMESIHTFRRHRYLNALSLAFTAMGHIESSREAAPGFVDLRLADGMYLYWRTIVTQRSSVLPNFGDHKAEGIAAMEDVEQNGVFIRPLATLALAFTFLEDGQARRAQAACDRNRKRYPDNVINNLVTTMVLVKRRNYDNAIAVLEKVQTTDPTNAYQHYWRGVAHLKKDRYSKAKTSLDTYLATGHLEKYQEAAANFRLGQLHAEQKDYGTAADHFQRAIKINGHKSSKKALETLKASRKAGTIDW